MRDAARVALHEEFAVVTMEVQNDVGNCDGPAFLGAARREEDLRGVDRGVVALEALDDKLLHLHQFPASEADNRDRRSREQRMTLRTCQ